MQTRRHRSLPRRRLGCELRCEHTADRGASSRATPPTNAHHATPCEERDTRPLAAICLDDEPTGPVMWLPPMALPDQTRNQDDLAQMRRAPTGTPRLSHLPHDATPRHARGLLRLGKDRGPFTPLLLPGRRRKHASSCRKDLVVEPDGAEGRWPTWNVRKAGAGGNHVRLRLRRPSGLLARVRILPLGPGWALRWRPTRRLTLTSQPDPVQSIPSIIRTTVRRNHDRPTPAP